MAKERYSNAQIIEALQATKGMVYLAAKNLKCHPDTIFKRARRCPGVQATIDSARGEVVDAAELALYEAILRKEGWAIAFTLRTIGRARGYVERQEHEHSGQGGGPIQILDVTKLTDEQLKRIADGENPASVVAPAGDS